MSDYKYIMSLISFKNIGRNKNSTNNINNNIDKEEPDISRLSNPTIVGPGVWFSIHLKARDAVTPDKKKQFIEYIQQLSEEFPCLKCRTHIQEYLSTNPFDDFYTIVNEDGIDIGLFKWSWIFHNTVNTRLGKPYMEWETAWSSYNNTDDGDMICSQECDKDSNVDSVDTDVITIDKNTKEIYGPDFDEAEEDEEVIKPNYQRSINYNQNTFYPSVSRNKVEEKYRSKSNMVQSYFLNRGISNMLN